MNEILNKPGIVIKHIIDCDADPRKPFNNWSVELHIKGGSFEWDPTRVELFCCEQQGKDMSVAAHKLYDELKDKPVLNACVLDYLLDHKDLIPKSWMGKAILFWGTIYRVPTGDLYIRKLGWENRTLTLPWSNEKIVINDWADFNKCIGFNSPIFSWEFSALFVH